MDWPRSPRARRPYQRKSWTWKGASRPSWRWMRATSSGLASGPAMIEAGSPGARWIRMKATVATTSATGMSASRRRAMYVFTRCAQPRSLRQPHVPEIHLVGRAVSVHLLADRGEPEEVAVLHPPDILVEDLLHLLPHGAPLSRIALPGEGVHPLLLVLVTPPAGPVAVGGGAERGLGIERDPRREHVPRLGLVAPVHEGRPVHDLQIDLEADRLELLPGHERVLVHPLIFLRRDPAHRLARVSRLLQELLRLR